MKLKRGDVNSKTGKLFWSYQSNGTECWVTKERFNEYKIKNATWRKERLISNLTWKDKIYARNNAWLKKKLENDPEYKIKRNAQSKAIMKNRRASDPEYRTRNAIWIKEKRRNNTEWKARANSQIHVRWKERYKTDPYFRFKHNLRTRMRMALKGHGKSASTKELQGGSDEFVRNYIASKFESWMTWENHGNYDRNRKTWHVDHIKPFAAFTDLRDPEQQKQACHYTNLQPLLARDNLSKGAR